MNEKTIPELCPPCEPDVDFIPQAIPELCPKPEEKDTTNAHLYPKPRYVEVVEDCLMEMLTNMTNNKFCKVGPRCCDK